MNSKNRSGNTPLHEAVINADKVEVLIEHGAMADLRNNRGETPLERAERKMYVDAATVLKNYENQTSI